MPTKQQIQHTKKKQTKAFTPKKKDPVWLIIAKRKVAQFVDKPMVLKGLYHVNSPVYGLQKRQRIVLYRILTVLLGNCEAEFNQVGACDKDDMKGIQHYKLREQYRAQFGVTIAKSTWFDYITLLKKANYLGSAPLYIYDHIRHGIEKTWRSVASMKTLLKNFWKDLNIDHLEDVKESRAKSIKDRIKSRLSNVWAGFQIFNERNKRKVDDSYIDINDVPVECLVVDTPYPI